MMATLVLDQVFLALEACLFDTKYAFDFNYKLCSMALTSSHTFSFQFDFYHHKNTTLIRKDRMTKEVLG
jgi:hypothetical protein